MKPLLLTIAITTAAALGQTPLAPPQLGFVASNGQLRPVLGLAANFLLGESLGGDVVSSAFSGSFELVKSNSSLLVLDRTGQVLFQADADPGPAQFAFLNDATPAFVYLPQSKSLLTWNSDHFDATPSGLDGTVLAIGNMTAIVQRDDGLWMIDMNAGTQTLIPGVAAPVLLRSDGSLLYSDSQSLVLRHADGTERRVDAPINIASFEQMGKDWVHVIEHDTGREFALRLEPGREQIFQLPDGAQ